MLLQIRGAGVCLSNNFPLCMFLSCFVRWFIREHESKSGKTSVLEAYCVRVCMCVCVCMWGELSNIYHRIRNFIRNDLSCHLNDRACDKSYRPMSMRIGKGLGIALRATDLRFSLESNCLKKSTSQLLLFINRCHVCCSQQKTSDYSVKNR